MKCKKCGNILSIHGGVIVERLETRTYYSRLEHDDNGKKLLIDSSESECQDGGDIREVYCASCGDSLYNLSWEEEWT